MTPNHSPLRGALRSRDEAGKDAGDPAAMSHLECPRGQLASQHVAA